MNNFQNQNWNHQQNNQAQSNSNPQNQPTDCQQPNNQSNQQQPSILMKLVGSCLPVLLEQFVGQSVPSMGGNNAEIQLVLSQVINLQQQLLVAQQNLDQRLAQLETSASQQFLGLAQEVKSIKSIRLTHDRERKQIEFNGQSNLQSPEN